MINVSIIVGTRPEAIKMAPVIIALKKRCELFGVQICATGQHQTMLTDALDAFSIKPDVTLSEMRPSQSLSELSSRILTCLDDYLSKTKPDLILVHGDTTTAMVGSLAAFYHNISVGHVEAGLRSNVLRSPFPEEFNRRIIAVSAKYNFAPTKSAQLNLLAEGVRPSSIFVTGNTVIDSLLTINQMLSNDPFRSGKLEKEFKTRWGLEPCVDPFILVTAHRRENFGAGITSICRSLAELARANPTFKFVYPVHLNPSVKNVVESSLSNVKNILLLPPLEYVGFTWLLSKCYLVLTDSGGIQEEAPSLGKPVLVMRELSERPEAIEAGTAKLVGSEPASIIYATQKLIDDQFEYEKMARAVNPFGIGNAADLIVKKLLGEPYYAE